MNSSDFSVLDMVLITTFTKLNLRAILMVCLLKQLSYSKHFCTFHSNVGLKPALFLPRLIPFKVKFKQQIVNI